MLTLLVLGSAPSTLPSVNAQSKRETKSPIWEGRSGSFVVRWDREDIVALPHRNNTPAFSARAFASQGFREFAADYTADFTCHYERHFTILSVVGSMVSLRDSLSGVCKPAAHPFGETRFITIDLSKSGGIAYEPNSLDVNDSDRGRILKLTDLFPESDILQRSPV
ncbi:MAG: hypothetical protein ABI882_00105 [Acidobacteriota bacterium]